jgi:transposase InsO family protein
VYYSPNALYRGLIAADKLADATGSTKSDAKAWLERQVFYQIHLPKPRQITRGNFNVTKPNEVHQADILYLPHDKFKRKTYKYALTIVDVGSRYKEAEPLTSKTADEVAKAFGKIYKRSKLDYPKVLQVDSGNEFKGAVARLFESHGTQIRRGEPNIHRMQGIVERFNRTLAEQIFGVQYAKEILLAARESRPVSKERSTEWVQNLPLYIANLNGTVTRMISLKPSEAIKLGYIPQQKTNKKEEVLELSTDERVRYLYEPGELEGGYRRATDPNWSLSTHTIDRVLEHNDQPILYYLDPTGPQRSFVREELLVVPASSELPPKGILTK